MLFTFILSVRYLDRLPLDRVQVAAFSMLASICLPCTNARPVVLMVVTTN